MMGLLLALVLSAVGGVLCVSSCGNDGAGSVTKCESDGDCPQPSNGRCGEERCVEGKCDLHIQVGPVPSQVYGDCQEVVCDWDGSVVSKEDSSDAYDDGRECTVDYCEGGKPVNKPLPEGLLCPTSKKGVCHDGECVECLEGGENVCEGQEMVCVYNYCTPFDQCAKMFCGGPCAPCYAGFSCVYNGDCLDGKCVGGKCQPPTCDDSLKNGEEEDVDCGGPTCGPCADGQGCLSPSDCQSNVCISGKCQAPTCFDGKKNGAETGIDCGGPCGPC